MGLGLNLLTNFNSIACFFVKKLSYNIFFIIFSAPQFLTDPPSPP